MVKLRAIMVCQFLIGTVQLNLFQKISIVASVKCQFLIGTVQRTMNTTILKLRKIECQFLIGTVQPEPEERRIKEAELCQFLIGTVQLSDFWAFVAYCSKCVNSL